MTNNLCHGGESEESEFKNMEPPPPLNKFGKHMLLDYDSGIDKSTGFWVGFGPDIKATKESTQADITRQIDNYDRMKNEELRKRGQPNCDPLPWSPNPDYFIIDKPWSPTVKVEDAYPVRTRGIRRPPAPKKGQVLAKPQGQIVACQPTFNTGQHGQKTGQYRCTTPGCYKYGNLYTEYGSYAAHEERFHRNLFSTCTPCPYAVYRFGRLDTCNIEFETAKDAQKHCKLTHGLKPEQCYDFVCQVARNGSASFDTIGFNLRFRVCTRRYSEDKPFLYNCMPLLPPDVKECTHDLMPTDIHARQFRGVRLYWKPITRRKHESRNKHYAQSQKLIDGMQKQINSKPEQPPKMPVPFVNSRLDNGIKRFPGLSFSDMDIRPHTKSEYLQQLGDKGREFWHVYHQHGAKNIDRFMG